MLVQNVQSKPGKQIVLAATCLLGTHELVNMAHNMLLRIVRRIEQLQANAALINTVLVAAFFEKLIVEAGLVFSERIDAVRI